MTGHASSAQSPTISWTSGPIASARPLGRPPEMSIPTSRIRAIAASLTRGPGSVPAERARHPGGGAALNSPSAIWERALLPTQTKSTVGMEPQLGLVLLSHRIGRSRSAGSLYTVGLDARENLRPLGAGQVRVRPFRHGGHPRPAGGKRGGDRLPP